MQITAKLLIVDGEPASRSEMLCVLEQAGLKASAVDSEGAVVAALSAENFGLVTLAGEVSTEAIYDIKERSPSISILRIVRADHAALAGDSLVDGFLVEPFEAREFVSLVCALLRLYQTRAMLRDSEARLRLVQDAGGLAVADCDLATGRATWSPQFAELFQLPPDAAEKGLKFDSILSLVHEDDKAALLAEYRRLLRRGGQFHREFRIRRPDESIAWVNARGSFIEGAAGRIERILCLCSDTTEHRQSESRNAQLAAIVASSIDAIASIDFSGRIRTWNHGAEQLFGYAAYEVLGRKADFFVPPGLIEERDNMVRRLTEGEAVEYQTQRLHKNGQLIDVWIRGTPMRRPDGSLFGASFIIRNVTAQKQREEHVRFLMRELTHRSKNLLAVIQAMARQSLSLHTSPEEFVARFTERLNGLAGSHDLLLSDDWAGASLIQLIRSQLQHYDDLFDSRIHLQGTDLILRPEAAQNIGIALHELSTNAAKFGALSVPDGTITVSWAVVGDGDNARRMQLRWKEQSGPPVILPTHKGFGRMVMDRIAGQALGGHSKAVFAPDGVCWELDVPAVAVIRDNAEAQPVPG
ncbi:MAG: PAS domain S-box protein [Methylovirgula sp.]